MLYLESMFFRVAAACLFLSSFLAEQGRAYTLDEENKPTNIAERLERLEMELKSQKQETENLKSTVQSLDNHVKTLTQFNEEQMVRNKDLETELDMMRVGNEQGYIPISENATTEERAKLGVQQVKKKFRQQRLLLDDMDASPVGFTAYLDHNTPNLGINQIIVFNRVLFNEGSAYNNSSGTLSIEMVLSISY